jgi:tetratricopeptide (TPR) repeat protein
MLSLLALAHFHAGQYEEALRHADRAHALLDARAMAVLAASLVRLGRVEEARRLLPNPLPPLVGARIAPYARVEDYQHLADALRTAGMPERVLSALR